MKIAKMPNGETEIYLAFQGEGKTLGKPIVFVRLSTCNLHCNFCDSFYTWNFEGTPWKHNWAGKVNQVYEQMEMTPQEVADIIKKVAGKVKAAVFTGGEPTLQQKDILEVISYLDNDWYYEIETNGTIPLLPEFVQKINTINCSPKLASSGNNELRNRPNVMKQFKELKEQRLCEVSFKFVIGQETLKQDLEEIKNWQEEHQIPNEWIYLMPEGIETKDIIEGSRILVEICKKENYNLSTRLQIILYGPRRGV